MDYPWYAIRIRTRHEKLIASSLHEKGFEVFLPLYRCRRRWSDRYKDLVLPLFPGYLFARFDIQKRLPILMTPGVLHVVGMGRDFYPVDRAEIEAVQTIVAAQLSAQPWPYMRLGQRVRIECGPLVGMEGILAAVKKPCRLVISVTLLQRSVAVEIDQSWVLPISTVGTSPLPQPAY